jgi:translation initiation factor IF-2
MAKMRVYELAKELKVDNKELVRQLIEMGLDVRNHMSTITPEEAQSVRDRNKESRSEVVEEKRVTRTVIRRRRKKVEADSGTEQPAEEKEAEAPAEAGQAQEEEAVAAAGAPEAAEEAPPEDAPEPAPESGPEAIVAECGSRPRSPPPRPSSAGSRWMKPSPWASWPRPWASRPPTWWDAS